MSNIIIFDKTSDHFSDLHDLGLNNEFTIKINDISENGLDQLFSICSLNNSIDAILLHTTDLNAVLGSEAPYLFAKKVEQLSKKIIIIFFSGGSAPEKYKSAILDIHSEHDVVLCNVAELKQLLVEYYEHLDSNVFIISINDISCRLLHIFNAYNWLYGEHLSMKKVLINLNTLKSIDTFENSILSLMSAIALSKDVATAAKYLKSNNNDWVERLKKKDINNIYKFLEDKDYITNMISEIFKCESSQKITDKIYQYKKVFFCD